MEMKVLFNKFHHRTNMTLLFGNIGSKKITVYPEFCNFEFYMRLRYKLAIQNRVLKVLLKKKSSKNKFNSTFV
jgi:hypothetical protein